MDRISDSDSEDAGSIPAGVTIFVYALRNSINEEIYVGISRDPDRRLNEHNTGRNRYTKAFAPWIIFYKEAHPNYSVARRRERYFKSASGKKKLKFLKGTGSLPAWRSQAGIPAGITIFVLCSS